MPTFRFRARPLLFIAAAIVLAQTATADTDEERIADLVLANRILADQGVLDGFGHVSVRSAKNPKHFYMARSRAAALVTREDIVEFDADSKAIDAEGRELYSERYIHGEIFRARPDVQAVVHSHSTAVLPFSLTKAPLKAVIHVAFFLGAEAAPVFDLRDAEGEDNHMLVRTPQSGAALARALGSRSVVLMRGHGMAVAGNSARQAVFKAIYTQVNAQVLAEAMKIGQPVFLNKFEASRTERIDRQWELWARAVADQTTASPPAAAALH
jgi:ribulose-5-phosphate 4-epimerase/fuculose-1-phosphate aldolase